MVNVLHQLLLSSAPGTTSGMPSHTNPALGLGVERGGGARGASILLRCVSSV